MFLQKSPTSWSVGSDHQSFQSFTSLPYVKAMSRISILPFVIMSLTETSRNMLKFVECALLPKRAAAFLVFCILLGQSWPPELNLATTFIIFSHTLSRACILRFWRLSVGNAQNKVMNMDRNGVTQLNGPQARWTQRTSHRSSHQLTSCETSLVTLD